MRTATLQARSLAFGEATFGVAVVGVVGVLAFVRMWELMIGEPWLAPLVAMMCVHAGAAVMVAAKRGTLCRETVLAEAVIKGLLVLAYVAGFAVQRMWDESKDTTLLAQSMKSFGHAVCGSLITIELIRFVAILRLHGVRVRILELAASVIGRTLTAELRQQYIQEKKAEGKAEGVIVGQKQGWQAACVHEWETGSVGPPPKAAELSGIIPAVRVDDSDADITAEPPAGEPEGKAAGGGLDSPG